MSKEILDNNSINSKFKVSIIIPIYNVAKYLDECISSLIEQDYNNIEIILINDGSTDGSDEICDRYKENDDRIIVLHKKNGGLMSAWKSGLHIATGDYIGFVDGDDWVSKDMYKCMVEKVIEYNAEIICCGYLKHYGTKVIESPVSVDEGIYFGEKLNNDIFPSLIDAGYGFKRAIYSNRCNKLIKRELLISNVKYCDDRISFGEDLNITVPICLDAKRIYVMKNAFFYYYRQNPNSITNSISYKATLWEEILLLSDKLRIVLNDKGFQALENQLDINLVYMAWVALNNECRTKGKASKRYTKMNEIVRSGGVVRGIKYLRYDKMSNVEKFLVTLIRYKMVKTWFLMQRVFALINRFNFN